MLYNIISVKSFLWRFVFWADFLENWNALSTTSRWSYPFYAFGTLNWCQQNIFLLCFVNLSICCAFEVLLCLGNMSFTCHLSRTTPLLYYTIPLLSNCWKLFMFRQIWDLLHCCYLYCTLHIGHTWTNYYNPTQGLNMHTALYVHKKLCWDHHTHLYLGLSSLNYSYIMCILFTVEHVLLPKTRSKFMYI